MNEATTTVNIRGVVKDVWLKAAGRAKESGKTLGQFVTEALREKLAKTPKK